MWSITILSNIGNNSLVFEGKTIKDIVKKHIETNPVLNEWLDETTLRNIRLGRRKHIEKWVIIEKIMKLEDMISRASVKTKKEVTVESEVKYFPEDDQWEGVVIVDDAKKSR